LLAESEEIEMAIVYYQLSIIITIIIAFLLGWGVKGSRYVGLNWARFAAVLWTIETLALVVMLPLILFQLLIIWGTYFAIRKFPIQCQEIIGEKHSIVLNESLEEADNILCIESAYANDSVINEDFSKKLINALQRGVNVYLAFGYGSGGRNPNLNFSEENARRELSKIAIWSRTSQATGTLYCADHRTHKKLLVCDDKFIVRGSCNWLSNKRFSNEEESEKRSDPVLAKKKAEKLSQKISKMHNI